MLFCDQEEDEEVTTVVTLEDACKIAAEWLSDISGCTEFTTAYSFYNPRSEHSIGGPDTSIVVLKAEGKCCRFTEFILSYGGGTIVREIKF